jgi:glycosyltransferase involved in cell wall biosynthesis
VAAEIGLPSVRSRADGVRVTIVHERFTDFAGSERVVADLSEIYPDALVRAPVVVRSTVPEPLRSRVQPGPLDRLVRGSGYAHLLPALPLAMRRLRLGRPDVVLVSHHAFASQVVHGTDAPVVAYVHSPARWVWDPAMRRGEAGGALGELALGGFAAAFRGPDRRAAARLHTVVANSAAVAERVRRWWGRDALVVHPPVDTRLYTPDPEVPREDFFLVAGRLVPYKLPQLAVRAAREAGVRLVVAGDGRARGVCEQLAGPGTTFLGRVDDATQRDLFRRCAAVLLPGVEDFGIVPVEAQACGAPVLAVAAGGALDTVVPGQTGELVDSAGQGEAEAAQRWSEALTAFRPTDYDPVAVRRHAEGFSREAFRSRMADVVSDVLAPRQLR